MELDGGKNESQASRNLNLTGHLVGWFNLVGGRGLITEHLTGRPGSKTDRTRGTEVKSRTTAGGEGKGRELELRS